MLRHNCKALDLSHPAFAEEHIQSLYTSTDANTDECQYFACLLGLSTQRFVVFKMPHSFGYRARTRDMFKRGFKGVETYVLGYAGGC